MLKEMSLGQQDLQIPRRWFTDPDLELIVWFDKGGKPDGFQLCYDRRGHERALTWTEDAGYRHDRIDDGEGNPAKNSSPILVSDGAFSAGDVLARFEIESAAVDLEIRRFVTEKLREYGSRAGKA
jgi:hypothetical protein